MSKRFLLGISLIIGIMLFSYSDSLSTDWSYIGSNDLTKLFNYYVDCDSITIDGNQVTYWSKVESKDIEITAIYGKTIDCKERKIRNADVHLYDRDGSILKSDLHGDRGEWTEIMPDSLNDVMRIILCDKDDLPKKNIRENVKTWENIALKLREEE